MLIALVVGIWIVRYFGPEYFGKFNYVTACLTFSAACIPLGTESILVSELVKKEKEAIVILSTAFVLYIFSGILFTSLSVVFVLLTKVNDNDIFNIVFILSIPFVLRGFTVPRLFFESQLLVKKIVIIENTIVLIFALIRVYLLYFEYPFLSFIWSFAFESILSSLGIFLYFKLTEGRISPSKFSVTYAKEVVFVSFPLLLSAITTILYMKVDQIMIGNIMGDKELGIYSVAVRISELWYFIPMAISTSFFPHLIKLYNENVERYWFELKKLHVILFSISLIVALSVQFFADLGVFILYGEEYSQAAKVLKINIWAGLFVFLGVAGSNHLVISKAQNILFYKGLFGLMTNLILNYIMIPKFGLFGAAIATLISQLFASSLFLIFRGSTFGLFLLQVETLKLWKWLSYFNRL
ncbi:flippase [Leptospira levettii]|nr:flippase [Leptospira levettii]